VPFSIQHDPDTRIVVLRATGPGNMEEGLRAFEAIRKTGSPAVLIDLLDLGYTPSHDEAMVLGEQLAKVMGMGRRIAFLAPPGRDFGVARMVSTISQLHGTAAAAFLDRDKAIEWLSGADA
jgi:hypothetical protein